MLPDFISHKINIWFNYLSNEIYCQVSTIANEPHVRTMMLYDVTNDGKLVFITNTSSQKWKELQAHSNITICLFDKNVGQVIIGGYAALKTNSNSECIPYWEKMTDYFKNYYLSESKNLKTEIPDSFGIIFVAPTYCEVLEICNTDYLKSIRTEFQYINKSWVERKLLPL